MEFAIPAEYRMKIKQNKKRVKHLDLARELKNNWKIRVTVMPVVFGALGTVPEGLEKGLQGSVMGTNQTTSLLRSARILSWVRGIWDATEKQSVKAGVK